MSAALELELVGVDSSDLSDLSPRCAAAVHLTVMRGRSIYSRSSAHILAPNNSPPLLLRRRLLAVRW